MHIVGSLGLLASPYIKLSGSLIIQNFTFQIAKNITKLLQ